MKKLIFTAALVLGCITTQIASAQISIGLHFNIGSQPDWGPVGYDRADYYYMPDIDAYYDVPAHQYVYYEGNVWVHRTYLPARYRGYDLYHGYKVVINRPSPWLRHSYYRTTYASYRGRPSQAIIRDSRDARYRNHWKGNNGHGNAWGHNNGHHDNGHHDNGHHGGGGNHGHGHH